MVRTKGYCKYCGKEYTKTGIAKHLGTCKKRDEALEKLAGKGNSGGFRLVISGKYNSDYWLVVKVKETASLEDLDMFIRDIWVECCGHLSCFMINGVQYERVTREDWWGNRSKSMNSRLNKVLRPGLEFSYEYDYGSTTELLLKVVGYEKCPEKDKITVLSRNQSFHHVCDHCKKQEAVWFNPENMYYGNREKVFLCEKCRDIVEEEGDWYCPVCNSPRMGTCGYEGSNKYPDEFLPDKLEDK